MPAPKPVAPSVLPELKAFAINAQGLPYDKLLPSAAEAGLDYRLVQSDVQVQPDASTLVTYDVFVGRPADDAPYQFFDKVTMHLLANIGPVSLAGRLQAMTTLVYLFFGRLPDPTPAQTVNVNAVPANEDIKLPGEDPLPPEHDDAPEQEYVDAPPPRRGPKMPSLIDHVEPDGVPVFIDLDDVPNDFTSAQIVEQFLKDVDAAAVKFSSKEQLLALYSKNTLAIDFIKDDQVANDDDRKALAGILSRHEARIEANNTPREVKIPGGKGSTVTRRRRAA